ncbi:uncharacterized protein IUM83_05510 [Phytophthora cinnamomi]|uniref:uncharacterized protein n=1 Tax=Phytophthora cinnamomi TaxID=4785 RepID=UPI002A3482B6|nr:hypothetical protein IUM83_05510 [Phytophthora cinnamomi]KAJ8579035.1 hypothetical protein ON010_g163 [Phytophthora cinnamomi]
MNKLALARELVRARLAEIEVLKKAVDQMNANTKKMLHAQIKLQGLIEDHEELNYELEALLADDDFNTASAQGDDLSFGVLLEMVVNTLKE